MIFTSLSVCFFIDYQMEKEWFLMHNLFFFYILKSDTYSNMQVAEYIQYIHVHHLCGKCKFYLTFVPILCFFCCFKVNLLLICCASVFFYLLFIFYICAQRLVALGRKD